MRRNCVISSLSTLLLACGAASAAVPNSAPPTLTLPAGTGISVRLGQSLDTKRDKPGSGFVAHVATAVTRDGEVLLRRGAPCRGHVVESKASGRLKGRAGMRLALDSCESQGRFYTITTSDPSMVSKNHKKRNLVLIGGGAGTGAGIGAIAGGGVGALIGAGAGAVAGTTGAIITGKRNLHLPAETRVRFVLERPLTVRVATQSAENRQPR